MIPSTVEKYDRSSEHHNKTHAQNIKSIRLLNIYITLPVNTDVRASINITPVCQKTTLNLSHFKIDPVRADPLRG